MFLILGKVTLRNTQKPACPQKPADLAERVRSLMAQTDDEQREFKSAEFLPGHTDVTQSMCFLPSQDSLDSSASGKSQLTSRAHNGSFDDLDIPYIDEEEDPT